MKASQFPKSPSRQIQSLFFSIHSAVTMTFVSPSVFFLLVIWQKKQTTKWDWWKIPSAKNSTRHCSSSLPGKKLKFRDTLRPNQGPSVSSHIGMWCFSSQLYWTKLLLRKPRKLYKQKTYRGKFQRAGKLCSWLRQCWVLLDYLLIPFFFWCTLIW